MGEERRIFEYFVVAGLPECPEELNRGAQECGYKDTAPQPPITDICVVFPGLGEQIPENFVCIESTPTGHAADLNHGSIRTPSCYLCYRRGYHKPPLVDIGVLYEGRGERVIVDSQIVKTTPFGRPANVNNASQGIYLTYRRASDNARSNLLAVTDICIILTNKGETPPHTFYKINKNLNKGMVGSDIFICYKKSMANCNRIAYKPEILDRFPLEDYPDYPFPTNVPIFGLPMGALLECWPPKCQTPARQFLTFVLTDQKGHKLYGAAAVFYETYQRPLTPEQLEKLGVNADQQQRTGSCSDNSSTNDPAEMMTFHSNKCIAVVSRYPFFTAFRRYLFFLFRMSLTGEYPLPIERYISHLLYEVPFPTSRRPRVLVEIGHETICFDNPEDSPLPLSGASFIDFVKLLGVENSMYLMLLALTEQKILIHSLRPWYLTTVAEALCSLLFPFHWQCPYIPQCPLDLAGVLHAPLPFIAGVDSRYFELYEDPPKDVTCVDLDTNTISQSDVRQKIKITLLPRKAAKFLRQQLEALEAKVAQAEFHMGNARTQQGFMPVDVDLQHLKRRRNLDLEIQEVFLRFMVQILRGYQHYLKPIRSAPSIGATDLESLYDVNGFLRSRDKSGLDFYKQLTNTQLFIRFVEERSLLSDKDKNAYLAFFDDCMTKIDANSSTDHVDSAKLLEYEYSSQSDRTVFFAPPEPQVPDKLFTYQCAFPKLQLENFGLDSLVSESGRLLKIPKRLSSHDAPSSAARRTKQEAKAMLRLAKQQKSTSALAWAKCLLSYAYSLWFTHLPAYAMASSSKQRALRDAYNVLDRMQSANLSPMLDEVCYRILIQVCGTIGQPVMAVKVFLDMKRQRIQPNAITYGFYNRAVLEAQWPSTTTLSAQKYWTKIRLSVRAIALLKRCLRERNLRARRTLSQYSTESGDFLSQASLNSQAVKKSSCDVASAVTAISNDPTLPNDHAICEDRTLDQGYHSQATDDSISVGIDQVQHFEYSSKLPGGGRCGSARLNEWNLAAFDEFYKKGRAIVAEPRSRSSLLSYDSAAGLLMSSDLSKLDDSVFFDTSVLHGKTTPTKRLRNRSLLECFDRNAKDVMDKHLKGNDAGRLCYSLSEPEGVRFSEGDTVLRKENDVEKPNVDSGSQLGSDAHILQQESRNEMDRKNKKLGNIPEEGHIESEDSTSIDSSSVSGRDAADARRSHSRSPTKSIRTTVTDRSHPLGFAIEDNESQERTQERSEEAKWSTSKTQVQKLLEKQPFEDELKKPESPRTDENSNSTGGSGLLGLSNFGRSSMRGLWNRINNATPISRLSKSHTMDANLQTPPRADSPALLSPDVVISDTPVQMDDVGNVGALSPALSHLVTQGAKMISRMEALQRSSDSFTRLKAGVSSVVKSFKGNLEQQLGSPMRGSWSSLSLGDAAALGIAPVPINLVGDDSSYTDEYGGIGGGLWLHSMNDDASSVTTTTGVMVATDFDSDPAFQLSSGETGSLLSCEFVPGGIGRLVGDGEATASTAAVGVAAIEVLLCTASRCDSCSAFLYDEEIMAGWIADDSELQTQCQFCGEKRVPTLTVVIRRQRFTPLDSWYPKTSSLNRRDKARSGQRLVVDNGIKRRSSFNSQSTATENVGDAAMSQNLSSSMDGLYSSPALESSMPSSPFDSCPAPIAEEKSFSFESTPKLNPHAIAGRRRAGSEVDGSLLKEAVNRRLFLDCLPSPKITGSTDDVGDQIRGVEDEAAVVSVPYLSPFVLRKELETVLSSEGDEALTNIGFIKKHPIIYWNLLYTFRRLSVPTHFISWLGLEYGEKFGTAVGPKSNGEETTASGVGSVDLQVVVRCVYDLELLHEKQQHQSSESGVTSPATPSASSKPIYLSVQQQATDEAFSSPLMHALLIENRLLVSKAVVGQIIDYLSVPNLHKPLMILINEHRKRATTKGTGNRHHELPKHFSIYRDILFLALTHFGRGVRRDDFDREYAVAFNKLPPIIAAKLAAEDRAPPLIVKACRKIFMPLDVC